MSEAQHRKELSKLAALLLVKPHERMFQPEDGRFHSQYRGGCRDHRDVFLRQVAISEAPGRAQLQHGCQAQQNRDWPAKLALTSGHGTTEKKPKDLLSRRLPSRWHWLTQRLGFRFSIH